MARRRSTPRLAPEERREQILDVTLSLAARHGFHDLSLDRIAKAAGITRPVVYSLFGDLTGLLHALADREEGRALAAVDLAIPDDPGPDDPPEQLLSDGMRAFLTAVHDEPDTWRLVLMPPEGTPVALRERVEANRARVLAQLERVVAWGVGHRPGIEALDAELLARMLMVLAEDAARLMLTHPRRYGVDRFTEFIEGGIAALPPRAA